MFCEIAVGYVTGIDFGAGKEVIVSQRKRSYGMDQTKQMSDLQRVVILLSLLLI